MPATELRGERKEFIGRMLAEDCFDPQLLEEGDEVRVEINYSDTDGWRQQVLTVLVDDDGARFVEYDGRQWHLRSFDLRPMVDVRALTLERKLPRLNEVTFAAFADKLEKVAAAKKGLASDDPRVRTLVGAARLALVDGADIETVRQTHFGEIPAFDRPRWLLQAVYDGWERLLKEDMSMRLDQHVGQELNPYQVELARLLKLSTLTPATYVPSESVRESNHAAVFAGDTPVILCGPSDDPTSAAEALALAASEPLRNMLAKVGKGGDLSSGVIAGTHVRWRAQEAAIASKQSGQIEPGGDGGPLIAIVLNDPHQALATSLCVTTETARIFDAGVPDLDDGKRLPAFARSEMPEEDTSPSP